MTGVAIALAEGPDLDGFRRGARGLIAAGISPAEVVWTRLGDGDLFETAKFDGSAPIGLPSAASDLIRLVVCHRDAERFALLYTLIWRLKTGEPHLLSVQSDPLVHRLDRMAKSVRRDIHKMHAFLRFKAEVKDGRERFTAWFEPEHFILDAVANFFVSRFAALVWSIVTPEGSLHWDGKHLTKGPAGQRAETPETDAFEDAWTGYYRSTFNPARINTAAMMKEMPKKYWRNMPETHIVTDLVRQASARTKDMVMKEPRASRKRKPKAVDDLGPRPPASLAELNQTISDAEPFIAGSRRAVLGEGAMRPALAFVGEQPGDQEDVQGHPFVGPAGKVLNRAMAAAGIERSSCYVTNAVKHFKYTERGKRRIHEKPTMGEIKHYRWWLVEELKLVQPLVVVALGASAALALTDRKLSVTQERGPVEFSTGRGFVTVHPSYLLRIQNETDADREFARFVDDLKNARALAAAA